MGNRMDFHDRYIAAWNEATRAGETTPVQSMLSHGYHGWTGRSASGAEPFSTTDAMAGFAWVVQNWQGSTVHASHRTVMNRGPGEAVVTYELSYQKDGEVLARAWMLESWRKNSEGWRLHRDFTEHGIGEPLVV